jgi:next-to-BRCA1 protein 1
MATTAPPPPPTTSLDTVITVKVNFENVTRRVKMPLRDTTPQLLEKQIRAFLHIPIDWQIAIERFSDSAGSYILLDPNNMSVYKQLYRAAKAKSKLKLRVTRKDVEEAVVPKPVTVEDAPESDVNGETPVDSSSAPSGSPTLQEETTTAQSSEDIAEAMQPSEASLPPPPQFIKSYEQSLLREAAKIADPEDVRRRISESRMAAVRNAAALNELLNKSTSGFECARFAICCNSCEQTTPDVHYHCSTCEDGDFDLCQSCVDQGITCHGSDHWLIKRTTKDGQIVTSTTETIAPQPKDKQPYIPEFPSAEAKAALARLEQTMSKLNLNMRTCNCCVEEHAESEFLHCQVCDDFDLCQPCFSRDAHGHHPSHGFEPAVAGTSMPERIRVKMAPGRNQVHHAICDHCDKFITGVRHKCLDCPDWDYCAKCVLSAGTIHPKHRFVPIYDPLQLPVTTSDRSATPVHVGICCDGPLCASGKNSYIFGIRYKCAVCHDVDFCAGCEASPDNTHNKTHPLIKFKTPVRHVSVTTTGEHSDGQRLPVMGDKSRAVPAVQSMNTVQTVVDVKPSEPLPVKAEVKEAKEANTQPIVEAYPDSSNSQDLRAVFIRDHVPDGTILPPNHAFEQTWVLRNEGTIAWPAGCSVKFVGGDYMGHVDSNHPAAISEIVSASESTVCYESLAPGEEFPFTVLLRTPARAGKIMSYWRLTTKDGMKFGHRLWCQVSVRALTPAGPSRSSSPVAEIKEEKPVEKQEEDETEAAEVESSQMIFPKLEKESPETSTHDCRLSTTSQTQSNAEPKDEFEDDEWDASADDFLTDEEYDILDASDEEFFMEQQKKQIK